VSMSKVMHIAVREFASTALTKGFIFGALVVPALLVPVIAVIGILISQAEPPADRGVVAIIDQTGEITEVLAERLTPEAIQLRRDGDLQQATKVAEDLGAPPIPEETVATLVGSVPQLTVTSIDAGPDLEATIEAQQQALRGESDREDGTRLLALAVIDPDALREGEEGFGGFDLYVRTKLDARTTDEVRDELFWSIRDRRFAAAGVDRERIAVLNRVEARRTQEVTETGTRDASIGLSMILPFAIMVLLFMGVMTGGQYLLTTTIEEKSSRVVEVLLSAVSPMQLMFGKILGQMCVGLSLLLIYNTLGIVALFVFQRLDLIEASTIAFMLVFFLLAYVMFASFMAAIGAAVNELREAQSLMTPVMMTLIIGFYLCFPVSQDPDATYAIVLSYIPPISPLIMMTRIASTEPPAAWEPWVAIALNTVAAYGSVWFAAKVFRVGLLMYGKPPNFRTLIRWVRMA